MLYFIYIYLYHGSEIYKVGVQRNKKNNAFSLILILLNKLILLINLVLIAQNTYIIKVNLTISVINNFNQL